MSDEYVFSLQVDGSIEKTPANQKPSSLEVTSVLHIMKFLPLLQTWTMQSEIVSNECKK